MMTTGRDQGFSTLELVVALAISAFLLVSVLALYTQGRMVGSRAESSVKIGGNVRLALDRVASDLRMAGFAVPTGRKIGGTGVWTPVVFHAAQSEIGFRADIDGGEAEIVCTPRFSSAACPLLKLRLDSIAYYQDLNCTDPGGLPGGLKLVATASGGIWQPVVCGGYSTVDTSIIVTPVTDGRFKAGKSRVSTVEHVYYRYTPRSSPPYGTLERYVRYSNLPDGAFPPVGATWTTLADHVSSFQLEYRDGNGAVLSSLPLSAADRAAARSISVSIEGYDESGRDGQPQLIQARSEVLLRNRF